jgi:hypothetical protein
MFLPAVSVLIVNSAMNEAPRVSWDRFPLRYLPVALFLIPGVQHAVKLPLGPFGIVVYGLIFGWLWLRTESIWLAAIAHGALNNWGQYAFKYMKDSVTPDPVTSDLAVLRAGSLTVLVVGVFLLWRSAPAPSLRGAIAYKRNSPMFENPPKDAAFNFGIRTAHVKTSSRATRLASEDKEKL